MIILGSGVINFSSDQWIQLYFYQNSYNVRLVSFYDLPGVGNSKGQTTIGAPTESASIIPSNEISSTLAGLSFSYSIPVNTGTVFPALVLNVSSVVPVLNFTSTSVAACIYKFSPTQEQLSFFYQTAEWDALSSKKSLSSYTNEIWINWASRGLYSLVPQPVIAHSAEVQTRGLILSTGDGSEEYPQMTFMSYGLDYDTLVVSNSSSDYALDLEVTPNALGRYSVIIIANGQMTAQYSNGSYLSTLYASQWKQIRLYQQFYGVRLVALNDIPTATDYVGKISSYGGATGCSASPLNLKPSSKTFTDPAGLKYNWSLIAGDGVEGGSCNFPATITDPTTVTPVLDFDSSGIAAAVINFGRNQEQMSFFLPCGSWSIACTTIGNIWFQWATRGFYTGIRRIYFTPQIDDFFLTTDGNDENGKMVSYRNSLADIQGLIDWMPNLNARLPKGSNVTIEMAFNG
ncbi:UNVERIFIED_CONTAM: hypothetical protein HDU68_004060 [Siphonaria sp. JEL0065]|nr:hypothetical protein HDU68_004060 [Siphonaria sp. JEL0065]